MARGFQAEPAFLGIEGSPAFVREPEGNGRAERFIRTTLEENPPWVHRSATVEGVAPGAAGVPAALQRDLDRRAPRGYQTPAAVRAAQLAPLLAAA